MDRYEALSQEIYDLSSTQGVETFSIGKTVEDRDIWGVDFGSGSRKVLMTGAIHAREWIASDLLRRLIRSLAREFPYSNLTVSVLPMLNPDGLVQAETNEEGLIHRKRQKTNANGVDLNRNFDVEWHPEATSPHNHPGEEPFSEPETRAIRAYVEKSNPEVLFDWHYRGGQIEGYGKAGQELAEIMAAVNDYQVIPKMHYIVRGSFGQWFLNEHDNRTALNIELDEYWPEDGRAIAAALEHLNADA